MHINTLLNLAANSLLICSSVHLLFRIFGKQDSRVWKHPVKAMLYKAVMAVTICGAAANIITLSTPSWSEILLNLGASGNWLFLSFYLYEDSTALKPAQTVAQAKAKPAATPRRRKKATA
jgi:hypothetical protein